MRTISIRALLVACAGLVGCTTSGSDDAGLELGGGFGSLSLSGSLALVRLERSTQSETASARVLTNAKVARYTGLDASSALKLLGADLREGDSCTGAGRLDDIPMTPEARVELLSVGPISLRVGDAVQVLAPRLFPDLSTMASGWFYAADTALSTRRSEELSLSAQGQQGVGRFELVVAAPSEVLGVELGGAPLESEGVLSRAQDVEFTWEPEDPRDRVELEVYAGGTVLSCSLRDDGNFVLSASKLAGLEQDPHASLLLRRVRVVATEMQGIETAYVRVASARELVLRVD
jgi:hypothetical protein